MAVTRYLSRFASWPDMADFYVFPHTNYEMSLSQPLVNPSAPIINTNYAYRLRGMAVPLKGLAQATIRFSLFDYDAETLDTMRDEMTTKLYNISPGYLVYSDGLRAQAVLVDMPSIEISYTRPHIIPVVLVFEIYGDFIP